MRSKISALGVKLLPKNLYSRLTLITVTTVITGYAIIYAYTNLPTQESGNPLTKTIWNDVITKINDIGTRTDGITSSVGGNIGIGTASPQVKLQIEGTPAPASGFADYSGTTPSGYYWPNGYAPETIFIRPSTGVVPSVGGQAVYRGGIGLGHGVGIYSVNPSPAGSSLYGDIRFHTTWRDGSGYRNSDRMAIDMNGNVGIGTVTPAYKLQVMGSVASNSTVLTSDKRYKKNIKTIPNSLDKVAKLNGVNFDWRIDEFKDKNFPEGKQVGFIAQEVEKVIPEVVTTDDKGYKGVEYANITAVLVEAIKELKSKNDKLEERIRLLESK